MAVQAEEILDKNKEEVRSLVRDHDVIYIYHNRIDKTGHSRDIERQAFRAAEEAMEDVVRLVKKLTSANATNVVITADHGFLYQDEVTESDFSQAAVSDEISGTDRRFVVGRYQATFANLGINKVAVPASTVKNHQKLLTGGVWCIADIEYQHDEDKRVDKALVDIMKNYMANKSFSRGIETLGAEASRP